MKPIQEFPVSDKRSSKGQAGEYVFIFALIFFIGLVFYFTTQSKLGVVLFESFSALNFITGMIAVTGACVVSTGLLCGAALVVFNGLIFINAPTAVVFSLLVTPLLVTLAYIIAKLGRGGG